LLHNEFRWWRRLAVRHRDAAISQANRRDHTGVDPDEVFEFNLRAGVLGSQRRPLTLRRIRSGAGDIKNDTVTIPTRNNCDSITRLDTSSSKPRNDTGEIIVTSWTVEPP